MLALFGTGVGLWFVYGILRASFPIVAANGLTEVQVLAIFAIKVRHALSPPPARRNKFPRRSRPPLKKRGLS